MTTDEEFNPELNQGIFSITPEQLLAHMKELNERSEMFSIQTASKVIEDARNTPIPRMLLSELWHENELCILFADTNTGKSILAVQIADSISRGKNIQFLKLQAEAQLVLYFDFELSDKQFEGRYTHDYAYPYQFHPNLLRASINLKFEMPEGANMEAYLFTCFEKAVVTTGAKVLIVDNLTFLKNETEKAKDALPLMKMLKHLKNKHGLSILVLAHTPKRDMSKPLTRNDLSGSKMLINFCDSAFAIGESTRDKGIRYIKQIKERATEKLYGDKNVIVCCISKPYNFLQFEVTGYDTEANHLKSYDTVDHSVLEQRVTEMLADDPNLKPSAMAKRLEDEFGNYNSLRVRIDRIVKKLNE